MVSRRDSAVPGMKQAILASLLLFGCADGGCAELQPVKDSAESAIDKVDAALVQLSAAYTAVCRRPNCGAGPAPEYCAAAKEALNLAIRQRNDLVGE